MLEFRKKTGTFESSVPGSGMLIYRINPAYDGNADGPPDEVYLFRPGGVVQLLTEVFIQLILVVKLIGQVLMIQVILTDFSLMEILQVYQFP